MDLIEILMMTMITTMRNQYNDYDEDYVESPPKTKNLNVVHVVKTLLQ